MIHDVAIIGAGPAGLCLARALSGHGLSVVLLERQAERELADPAFDGREIALTHASQALLRSSACGGASPPRMSPCCATPRCSTALAVRPEDPRRAGGRRALGHLVANQAIRRAAFEAVAECADVQLRCETSVRAIRHHPGKWS